jgi:hypothetical protein
MTNFVTGLIGVAGVSVFLGIMIWWIKALPLAIIMLVALALLIYDYVTSLSNNSSTGS